MAKRRLQVQSQFTKDIRHRDVHKKLNKKMLVRTLQNLQIYLSQEFRALCSPIANCSKLVAYDNSLQKLLLKVSQS